MSQEFGVRCYCREFFKTKEKTVCYKEKCKRYREMKKQKKESCFDCSYRLGSRCEYYDFFVTVETPACEKYEDMETGEDEQKCGE